jgi:phosphate transport system substrate-binding protein
MKKTFIVATALAILTLPALAQLKLNGAGATFPYVIYSKWFDVYSKKAGVQFNYQSIGSGGGIKQVTEGTVDFGATDAFLSEQQIADIKSKQNADVLHIPTVMGAVVIVYNVPEIGAGLRLTPDAIAGIFLGEITKWNDPKLVAINPNKSMPDAAIIVSRRSDGSGTTNIFTDYLSKVSKTWSEKVGKGTAVNWPVGMGGKGNEGVAGVVKQAPGSIGYVELAYAVKNRLEYAKIQNKAGNYVEPTFKAVSAAAASAASNMPADLRVMITDADGKDAYPISAFTWLLVYKNGKDTEKAKALVGFLRWAMNEGQQYAEDLYYAPLPKEVVKMCDTAIGSISVQ